MSIASEITRLQTAKASLKTSLENKGVTVAQNVTLDSYPALVDSIETDSGGEYSLFGVKFYDYDGTVLYQYTRDEFLALTALPENPTHEILVSSGWNYSLATAQAYMQDTNNKFLAIGQVYDTPNGSVYLKLNVLTARVPVQINFTMTAGTVTIDWGDNTTADSIVAPSSTSKSITHSYAASGNYTVVIASGDATLTLGLNDKGLVCDSTSGDSGSLGYQRLLPTGIYIGSIVTGLDDYTFNRAKRLAYATMPNNFSTYIDSYTFGWSHIVKHYTLPFGLQSINDYAFYENFSLETVSIPENITSISSHSFDRCYSLKTVFVPDTVTSIANNAFRDCKTLKYVRLSNSISSIASSTFYGCSLFQKISIPASVTSIDSSAFYENFSLLSVEFEGNNVTTLGESAFRTCVSLRTINLPNSIRTIGNSCFRLASNVEIVNFPTSLTSIGTFAFSGCSAITDIILPEGLLTIGGSAFYGSGASYLFIPSTVTSIGDVAFVYSMNLVEIHVAATTPPTITSTIFNNINSDAVIYVPQGTLETYQSASNWSSYSDKMQEEPSEEETQEESTE